MGNCRRMIVRGVLGLALALGLTGRAVAQGVTTGAVGGVVSDKAGGPIEGANVVLRNAQTGLTRKATTNSSGRYLFPSLEVGAGYSVSANAIGYRAEEVTGFRVTIGQTVRVDVALEKQAAQLDELVATAPSTAGDINPTRQGPQTIIGDTLIRRLPSLNRRLSDLVRTSPQVVQNPNGGGLSAVGQNNRFNNIQLDGTTATDRFGLGSTGELGGQASGRGITQEAIKEVQVVVSPFNVTQGNFTGALINGVTKNGTNTLTGTAFLTFRNQQIGANDPFIRNTPFSRYQFGGSVGGPIVKDKIFFFLAGEGQRASFPAAGPYIGGTGTAATRVTQAQVDSFTTLLQGYGLANPGSAAAYTLRTPLLNTVARLDFQLNQSNRLVVRNIYNQSNDDNFSRTGAFLLTSNLFTAKERNNSSAVQLFSSFQGGASNELTIGYNRIRFKRAIPTTFPMVSVTVRDSLNVPTTLRAGAENSSQGNALDQDILEIRNDFTFPINQRTQSHLITFGTRNEFYKVRNLFFQNSFGNWTFPSLTALASGTPNQYQVGVPKGADSVARFKAATFSLYAQDQWTPADNFSMTVGMRVEAPGFFDSPQFTQQVLTDVGRNTANVASWVLVPQPRLGFNWDVTRDQRNQVRGGIGVFAGNPVYVWLSNLFGNSGAGLANLSCTGTGGPASAPPAFNAANAANAPRQCGGGGVVSSNIGTVNTADPGLKFPQVMRASLAYDRVLPYGFIGTVEGTYTQGLTSLFYQNLNLRGPVGTGIGGRVLYGTFNPTTGIATPAVVNTTYGNAGGGILDVSNQGSDYSYTATAGLRKRFGSTFEFAGAYTYGRSYSVQDLTSSVALSNWRFGRVYSGLQSDKTAGISNFDIPHRIVISATYTAPWKKFPTDLTVFYTGQSGAPYAYVAFSGAGNAGLGDLNADGFNGNDPIYIPTNATNPAEVQFRNITTGTGANTVVVTSAAAQAAAFNSFIDGDPCLSKQRGQIMQRNSCRNPWFNQLDVSLRQSLPEIAGQRLTLQADVFNFLNLLNKNWGQYKAVVGANNLLANANNNVPLLDNVGFANGAPVFQFNPALLTNRTASFVQASNFWQAQFTIRYAF